MQPGKISAHLLALAAIACSATTQQPATSLRSLAAYPERNSPAFAEAARLQAPRIAALAAPNEAGIWLVQDANGHLLSSGVLTEFPATISSSDYATVVPGAAGLHADEFGFARTSQAAGFGPFRVAYVVVAASSQRVRVF